MAACHLARWGLRRNSKRPRATGSQIAALFRSQTYWLHDRAPSTARTIERSHVHRFGFVFDIDGVLLRSNEAIPGAREALTLLREQRIPFMLLTNGGGKSEQERVAEVNDKLQLREPIATHEFVQSHTPFQDLAQVYKGATVLVVGGDDDKCRQVAEGYGFGNVVVPGDLLYANPDLWPFAHHLMPHYQRFARPLPKPLYATAQQQDTLKFDAIFVYNDSRDWGLDATIMADILLSRKGVMGTKGKQAENLDGSSAAPQLYWANPDVLWASKYHVPRIGQGGFRAAFWGLMRAMETAYDRQTGSRRPNETMFGKPNVVTMQYCEDKILNIHRRIHNFGPDRPQRIYMIGDNPASDIDGANRQSQASKLVDWYGILVQTGVYAGESLDAAKKPHHIAADVLAAVKWALKDSR